jgi:hypothetical protein
VAKASSNTSKTQSATTSKAKAGLNPNTGIPTADSNLGKVVAEVPYTGQRGY